MSFKNSLLATTLVFAGLQSAQAAIVYREVFPHYSVTAGSTQQKDEATAQGWFGAQHGNAQDVPGGSLFGQIAKAGTGNPNAGNGEPAPINSNPQGSLAPETGFLFWSPAARAGIYLYTNEVGALNLSSAGINSVSWDSRNSGDNSLSQNDMHLALRIAGNWYVSDFGEPHSSGSGSNATWETNSFTLAGKTFALFDDHNSGETADKLPRNNDGSTGLSLPVGTVEAIGLWIQKNDGVPGVNPTIRIDNFTIDADTSVPAPLTGALLGSALLGLAGLRRRTA